MPLRHLGAHVGPGEHHANPRQACLRQHAQQPGRRQAGSVVDVAGVGDKAFEVDSHGSAGIFFRKGDALVAVSVVFYLAASPPTDQVRALAKTVASRI